MFFFLSRKDVCIIHTIITAGLTLLFFAYSTSQAGGQGFVHGRLPDDGWGYRASKRSGNALIPGYFDSQRNRVVSYLDGQRLSGSVAIDAGFNTNPPLEWRLLVDGVVQPSKNIDTTHWTDGTHVLACEVKAPPEGEPTPAVRSGSKVVVFNNGAEPLTDLSSQAIVNKGFMTKNHPSLAWGRVDVGAPVAYPLDPQLKKHPKPETEADRNRLASEKIWWIEGLNHAGPTPLWMSLPILMKNRDGDYFIKNFNPEGGGAGAQSVNGWPYTERAPAYDGPRGIGWVSPYTTLIPDRYEILPSGQTGWIGVDLAGRVVRVDIDGSVTTVFGPRSVAGVVGTDNEDSTVGLSERLAAGEKEFVGDYTGDEVTDPAAVKSTRPLAMSQDLWVCDSFPFEGIIADTGNNRVVELHFEEQRLMREYPIREVSSVWGTLQAQQELRIAWFAVNPEGLWQQTIEIQDGKPVGHGAVSKVADIPNAFWVRAFDLRVFVMTTDLAVYEYDPATRELVNRRAGNGGSGDFFVYMALDENGSIGPKHRIYWSAVTAFKTTTNWLDTNDWTEGAIDKRLAINRQPYNNWTAVIDPLGHYSWGFSPHWELPKFVSAGITSSSWFIWSACLGEQPVPDPDISYLDDMRKKWYEGVTDMYLAPGAVWGAHGHGQIGFSADQFRDYETFEEARSAVLQALEPFFSPGLGDSDREKMARQFFSQRTRKRFFDGSSDMLPRPPTNLRQGN